MTILCEVAASPNFLTSTVFKKKKVGGIADGMFISTKNGSNVVFKINHVLFYPEKIQIFGFRLILLLCLIF